jgi:hypothetical protein
MVPPSFIQVLGGIDINESIENIVETFIGIFPNEEVDIGRYSVITLKPMQIIDPHVDKGFYEDIYNRFHIPLATTRGAQFYSRAYKKRIESVHMGLGELWWLDNKREYWVENTSSKPMVHLVIDALVFGFRRESDGISKRVS